MRIANALKSISLRLSDLIARYGGEEFAVILPGCPAKDAVALAERIRLAVFDLAIFNEGSPIHQRVSISIGATTFWPIIETIPTSLIKAADRALYQSKAKGKNCTTHFAPIVEPATTCFLFNTLPSMTNILPVTTNCPKLSANKRLWVERCYVAIT